MAVQPIFYFLRPARLQSALKEAEKKKAPALSSRGSKEDSNVLHDLRDQLAKEKEKVEELTHQLKEERDKVDKSGSMERSE